MPDDDQDAAASPQRHQPGPPSLPVAVIVVAAGRGRRFGGGDNKVLLPLDGRPVWLHSAQRLAQLPAVGRVVIVARPEDRPQIEPHADRLGAVVVDGGHERYDSVAAGLASIDAWIRGRAQARPAPAAAPPAAGAGAAEPGAVEPGAVPAGAAQPWLVAVHDAARPLVSAADCQAVIQAAGVYGAAVLAGPLRGTIKRLDSTGLVSTVDRSELWEAYTPQVFRLTTLLSAYERWDGRPVTDDAELVERAGIPLTLVPGSAENLKITQPEDLVLAAAVLAARQPV